MERDTLKENNEELKCLQMQAQPTAVSPSAHPSEDDMSEGMIPPDVRQRLMRLEHENKLLKLNQRGPEEEKVAIVQALLDDANQRNEMLTAENRRINQRLIELESQVRALCINFLCLVQECPTSKKIYQSPASLAGRPTQRLASSLAGLAAWSVPVQKELLSFVCWTPLA